MSRPKGIAKERKHIHLTEGSWDRLTELYQPQGVTNSHVIDQLVSFHLRRVDEKIALKAGAKANVQPEPEDVEDLDLDGVSDVQ